MKYIYISLLSITLVTYGASSQTISTDSINRLYSLAIKYHNTNSEKSLSILNSVIENSKEINYQKGLYGGYYLRGYIYQAQSKIDQALSNYFIAWKISLIENYQKKIIKCLTAIGKIYFTVGHYESAQIYYSDALTYSVKEQDTINIANFNKMIGMCKRKVHELDSAFHYYNRAINYYSRVDNMYQVAFVNNLIGLAYMYEDENYEQSREYYLKAYKINRDNGDEISLEGHILNNIGFSYFKEEDLTKAEDYYLQAVWLNPENKEMKYFEVIYNNLGELKLSTNNIKKAEEYFIKSEQVNNSPVLEIERHRSFENLYEIYKSENRFSEYLPYTEKLLAQSKELIKLKDLLNKMLEQYQLKIVEYQRQLVKERFEKKIERQIFIIIIVSLSLLIVLVVVFFTTKRFLFYRNKWRKLKDKYNHFATKYNDFREKVNAAVAAQLKLNRELGILANTELRNPREFLWKSFDDDNDDDDKKD